MAELNGQNQEMQKEKEEWQERRDQRMREIREQLETGVKQMFTTEQYKNYLNTMAKFHSYSFNNTLLIAMQKPNATLVAGYDAWERKFNRHVMRGEKGIQIFAPMPIREKQEVEKRDPLTDEPIIGEDGETEKEIVERTVPRFRIATVFDISQTYGEPLPQLEAKELLGTAANYNIFMEAVQRVSSVPIRFDHIAGTAKGSFNSANREIVIQNGMSERQTMKTAVHEVAHAKLHDRDMMRAEGIEKDRMTREVEAESVAYVVCQYFGLDTSDYSFPYIASWSSGRDMQELRQSMETVVKTADNMIENMEYLVQKELDEQEKQKHLQSDDLILKYELPSNEGNAYFVVRNMEKTEVLAQLKSYQELYGQSREKEIDVFLQEQGAVVIPWYDSDGLQVEQPVNFFDVSFSFEKGAVDALDLSIMHYINNMINRAEYRETLFDDEERNLISNYGTKFDNKETVKTLVDEMVAAKGASDTSVLNGIVKNARREISSLPDSEIGLLEMHEYGYRDNNVLPLKKERALALYRADVSIYSLNRDGSRNLIESEQAIRETESIFGIEAEEWKRYQAMREERRKNESKDRHDERLLLNGEEDRYGIYQLAHSRGNEYRFMGMDYVEAHNLSVDGADYDFLYGDKLPDQDTRSSEEILEDLFKKFNGVLPTDYFGYSMTMSDVVVLHRGGEFSAHYVDRIGHARLQDFVQQRQLLQEQEQNVAIGMGTAGIAIEGHEGTWHTVDSREIQGHMFYRMEHDTFGASVASVIVDKDGRLAAEELWNGFDGSAMDRITEHLAELGDEAPEQQKEVVTEKAHVPFYAHPLGYARDHDELDQYRASKQENIACKKAIENSIRESFDGMHLDPAAVDSVLEGFGKERMLYVLAATVREKEYDKRFSRDTVDWAQTVPSVMSSLDYVVESHPYVLDGFISMARKRVEELDKEQQKGKPDPYIARYYVVNDAYGMKAEREYQYFADIDKAIEAYVVLPNHLDKALGMESSESPASKMTLISCRNGIESLIDNESLYKSWEWANQENEIAYQKAQFYLDNHDMEIAYQIGENYFMIQTAAEGYDYTFFDKDFHEVDGGVITNKDFSMGEAVEDILSDKGLQMSNCKVMGFDELQDKIHIAEHMSDEKWEKIEIDKLVFDIDQFWNYCNADAHINSGQNLEAEIQSIRDRITNGDIDDLENWLHEMINEEHDDPQENTEAKKLMERLIDKTDGTRFTVIETSDAFEEPYVIYDRVNGRYYQDEKGFVFLFDTEQEAKERAIEMNDAYRRERDAAAEKRYVQETVSELGTNKVQGKRETMIEQKNGNKRSVLEALRERREKLKEADIGSREQEKQAYKKGEQEL